MTAVEISDDAAARLAAEAARRGASVDEVASAVLTDNLPPAGPRRYRWMGIGASGKAALDRDEERAKLAARPLSEI